MQAKMSGWGSNIKDEALGEKRKKVKPGVPRFSVSKKVRPRKELSSLNTNSPPRENRKGAGIVAPPSLPSPLARVPREASVARQDPGKVFKERMSSWAPSLPFPFDIDMDEYDSKGSQKMVEFKTRRSGAAMEKYLQTVDQSKKAVEERRRTRERELEEARERLVKREVERMKEEQLQMEEHMHQEEFREQRLYRAYEREAQRVAGLETKKKTVAEEDKYLDDLYETQLDTLRKRERSIAEFVSRRFDRDAAHAAIQEETHALTLSFTATKAQLQEEHHRKHVTHTTTLQQATEDTAKQANLHQAMELGRLMRLAGVKRADEAQQLGVLPLTMG